MTAIENSPGLLTVPVPEREVPGAPARRVRVFDWLGGLLPVLAIECASRRGCPPVVAGSARS